MKLRFFSACLALACIPTAYAASVVITDNVTLTIPDGSSSGLARNLNVATTTGFPETITSISVSVQIAATTGNQAFLGDLYIYVTNGSDSAILLNRAGRSVTVPSGYGDNQIMDVTFSVAASENIHNYRDFLTAGPTIPLSGPLTGIWLADGRPTDPANVLDTDLSTAGLDQFIGASADGDWSFFVADLSGGGEHQLVSWTLTLETVPEPSALLLTLGVVPLLLLRRRR